MFPCSLQIFERQPSEEVCTDLAAGVEAVGFAGGVGRVAKREQAGMTGSAPQQAALSPCLPWGQVGHLADVTSHLAPTLCTWDFK